MAWHTWARDNMLLWQSLIFVSTVVGWCTQQSLSCGLPAPSMVAVCQRCSNVPEVELEKLAEHIRTAVLIP